MRIRFVRDRTSGVLAGTRLDHSSPVPLYHQTARVLEKGIEDGRLPRGSKLDNELDLAEYLGISRPTMRAAIKQLVGKACSREAGHRYHRHAKAREASGRLDQLVRRLETGGQGTAPAYWPSMRAPVRQTWPSIWVSGRPPSCCASIGCASRGPTRSR